MTTPSASLPVLSIRMVCENMADHASAARATYVKLPDEAAYHRNLMDAEFHRLAGLMGYDLVKREAGE